MFNYIEYLLAVLQGGKMLPITDNALRFINISNQVQTNRKAAVAEVLDIFNQIERRKLVAYRSV